MNSTKQVLKVFALLVFSALAFNISPSLAADSVNIRCITDNSQEVPSRTCSIEENGLTASDGLITTIKSMIDFVETPPSSTDGICSEISNDPSFSHYCTLENKMDQSARINLGCNRGTNTASCELLGSRGESLSALQFVCEKGINPGVDRCIVTSDSSKMREKMEETEKLHPNISAMADSFMSCIGQNTFVNMKTLCDEAMKAMQDGDPSKAIALMKSLQPMNPSRPNTDSQNDLASTLNIVSNRMMFIRQLSAAQQNASNDKIFYNGQWFDNGTQLASNAVNDGTPQQISTNLFDNGRLGIYLNASAVVSSLDDGDNELSSESSGGDLVLGIDYRLSHEHILGVAVSLNQNKTIYDQSVNTEGDMTSSNYSLTGYYSYFINNGYIDLTLTAGGSQYDQNRKASGAKYNAEFYGQKIAASIAGGYNFNWGPSNLTPFLEISAGQITTDSFKEKGGAAALEMDDQSFNTGNATIGLRFSHTVPTNQGVFSPNIGLKLINDFETDPQEITGRFVQNTAKSNEFKFLTTERDDQYMVLDLGFSFQLKQGNSGFLNIESLQGYEDLEQTRLNFGWRWEI